MTNNTLPLPFEDDDSEARAALNRRREMRERETILVHTIVTGIATPLARAFRDMPETGLLTTRYQLYTDTCVGMLANGHVIPFLHHDIKIADLLDHVWRTTEASA